MCNVICIELDEWEVFVSQNEEEDMILLQYYKNGHCYYTNMISETIDFTKDYSTD